MQNTLVLIFISFAVNLFSTNSGDEHDPNFHINISFLQQNKVQYYGQFMSRDDLGENGGLMANLFLPSWEGKSRNVCISKSAFILPINADVFMSKKLYVDSGFLRALYPILEGVIYPDAANYFVQNHSYRNLKVFKTALGRLDAKMIFSVFDASEANGSSNEILNFAQQLGDDNLGLPLRGVILTLGTEVEHSVMEHLLNVSKVFALGDTLLAVNYRIAVMSLPWIIRKAMEKGADSFVLNLDKKQHLKGIYLASKFVRAI